MTDFLEQAFHESDRVKYRIPQLEMANKTGMMKRSAQLAMQRQEKEVKVAESGERVPLYIYDKNNPGDYARFFGDIGMATLDMLSAPLKGTVQGSLGLPGDIVDILHLMSDIVQTDANAQQMVEIGKKLAKLQGYDPDLFSDVGTLMDKLPSSEELKQWFDSQKQFRLKNPDHPFETMGEFLGLPSVAVIKSKARPVIKKAAETLKETKQFIKKKRR